MATCDRCRRRFHQPELVTVVVQVLRQTHLDPAEYEEMRLCHDCAKDTGSRDEEMRGYTDEELERI